MIKCNVDINGETFGGWLVEGFEYPQLSGFKLFKDLGHEVGFVYLPDHLIASIDVIEWSSD